MWLLIWSKLRKLSIWSKGIQEKNKDADTQGPRSNIRQETTDIIEEMTADGISV